MSCVLKCSLQNTPRELEAARAGVPDSGRGAAERGLRDHALAHEDARRVAAGQRAHTRVVPAADEQRPLAEAAVLRRPRAPGRVLHEPARAAGSHDSYLLDSLIGGLICFFAMYIRVHAMPLYSEL